MDKNLIILIFSSFKALAIVFLTIVLSIPVGILIQNFFNFKLDKYSKISLYFALGFIFQSLLVFLIHFLKLQHLAYQFSYFALAPLAFLVISKIETTKQERGVLIFIIVSSVLYCHLLVFTGASEVSAESSRVLNGYYTDNLISFNTARIFTEALSIKETIVVPVWTFFDRTPVAGALIAYLWFFAGIKEKALWLSSTGDNFYFYQAQIIFLNFLSLFALAGLLLRSRQRVLPILFLIIFAPFFFTNVSFAWPKYLSAFFIITGISILSYLSEEKLRAYKEYYLTGFLVGFGFLTHDSAVFFITSLFLVLFFLAIFKKFLNIRQFLICSFGLLTAVIPWFLFRAYYETKSSHMFALHLFCIKDFSYQDLTFEQLLNNYLASNSIAEIIKIKFGNLLYPYAIIEFFRSLKVSYFDFNEWLKISAILSKYQLLHALTAPVFFLSMVGLWKDRKQPDINWFIVLAALGAVIPAAMLFGCEKSTWNHTWVYVSSLLLVLPLISILEHRRYLYIFAIFSCLSVTAKLLAIQANFFDIASFAYLFWLAFLVLVLFNLVYFEKCYSDQS